MRMPSKAVERLPQSRELGAALRDLLEAAVQKHPQLLLTAKGIVEGSTEVPELDQAAFDELTVAATTLLKPTSELPAHTARAASPLNPNLIWGWGELGDDPDAKMLATWILQGAPLGFEESIPSTGVFPRVSGTPADLGDMSEATPLIDDWENWPSALEEKTDLQRLVREAESKGFCELATDLDDARRRLGGDPILSKLGVVVKFQGEQRAKKSRIIWDLRESGVNERCDPAERVVLPRLLDVVLDTLRVLRKEGTATFAAVDIQDAFHNVPAGSDRRYTVASAEMEDGKMAYIIYNVLVFGSRSSPTLWGRFAALLGRILACTVQEVQTHIYVDDPILCIPSHGDRAVHLLTLALLCTKLFGFPLKLAKASAGKNVKWIGAELSIDQDESGLHVLVRIPQDKVQKLLDEVDRIFKAPVVGVKQLRSFAGGMAFVAGLVPVLRPFLSPLWAALAKELANDGSSKDRSKALLRNEYGPLERRFNVDHDTDGWEIITDACPWGIGGVLYQHGVPKRWFSSPLTSELLQKFKAQVGDPAFNTAWEALALLVALRLWLTKFPRAFTMRVKSDNVGALRMLLKLTSQSSALATIAREVALDIAGGNYQIGELMHVPGVTNVSRLWAPHPADFPFLGAAVKDPLPTRSDEPKPAKRKSLSEGFAMGPRAEVEPMPEVHEAYTGPKAYSRGSMDRALKLARHSGEECAAALIAEVDAQSSRASLRSLQSTWERLATQAGFSKPFELTPNLVFTVVGVLKAADYRSAANYLEAAKRKHVQAGHPLTDQLKLACKMAIRSSKRDLGPSKQAEPLKLAVLANFRVKEALHPGASRPRESVPSSSLVAAERN
eukprot:s2314_g6.t1